MCDNFFRVSLVSTGEEILRGEVLDTNASFASELLDDNGFSIYRRYTCGDEPKEIQETIHDAVRDADVVIICGGLGPTLDDRTVDAVSAVLSRPVETDENFVLELKTLFKKMGIKFSSNQARQARRPENAEFIPNPHGTAPGIIAVTDDGKLLFCLPGPPREFKPMMKDRVLPRLLQHATSLGQNTQATTVTLRAFGAGEGLLAEMLGDLESEIKGLRLGFRAALPEIHIKLRMTGLDTDDTEKALTMAQDLVRQRIGRFLFGNGEKPMAEVVLDLLKDKNMTLAVAESCTGGLVAKLLTDVPGASEVFLLSAVTYSNESKSVMLNVPSEIIEKHGAVSQQCVKAMAQGVRARANSSIAVAVTGIAGPGGGTENKPIGTVWFAMADEHTCKTTLKSFPNLGRDSLRAWASYYALDLIRRSIA